MEDWLKDFKVLFKKTTGLDYDNYTQEEYNEWYHSTLTEIAQEDMYTREILNMAESIITEKNYPTLTTILENYDQLVKEKSGCDYPTEYPYWSCAFGYDQDKSN